MTLIRATALALTVSLLTAGAHAGAADFKIGVARADITPDSPIWLSGYAGRPKPSQGVASRLFTKALSIEDPTGARSVIITTDLIGLPRALADSVAERLQREFQIPRERVLINSSHTHTGPVVEGNLNDMYALTADQAATVAAHTKKIESQMFAAANAALADLAPAQLEFADGRARFAANRRVFRPGGVAFGVNPDGLVDHDVPVLRAVSPDGRLRAILFGYACHATTLGGDFLEVCGDWPGFAQEYLELANPGATALFLTGCGADANPEPRGKLQQSREHGLALAGAVADVLSRPMQPINRPLRAAFERLDLPLATPPTRADFEARLKDKSVYVQRHARRQLAVLDRDGKLPATYAYPVQLWRFGTDLTLVALGGEVVVDYSLRLKRELGPASLWIAAYSNDVPAYIPSVRILLEGGYEAEYSMLYYGLPTRWSPQIEDLIVRKVHDLADRTKPN